MSCRLCGEFFKSLFYYIYPSNDLPHCLKNALSKLGVHATNYDELGEDAAFMNERQHDWYLFIQ